MPFDWIRTPVGSLSRIFEANFEDFLLEDSLCLSDTDPPALRDVLHGIVLPHDVDSFLKGGPAGLRSHFAPRVLAFQTALRSGATVVLVRRRITVESAEGVLARVRARHPSARLKLLAFNDRHPRSDRTVECVGDVILCHVPRGPSTWRGSDFEWDWALDAAIEIVRPQRPERSLRCTLARAVLGSDWVGLSRDVAFLTASRMHVLEALPPVLIEALIAAEDHRFMRHHGIDYVATARALFGFVTRRSLGGGSTLEQQLYRTITGRREHTLGRKVRELIGARLLESIVPKSSIPRLYLAVAYFGAEMVGVERAVTKLGLSLESIDEHTAAMIVARLKYPQPGSASPARLEQIERRSRHVVNRLRRLRSARRSGDELIPLSVEPARVEGRPVPRGIHLGPSMSSMAQLIDWRRRHEGIRPLLPTRKLQRAPLRDVLWEYQREAIAWLAGSRVTMEELTSALRREHGAAREELLSFVHRADVQALIRTLDVQASPRYQPSGGHTYCNVYVYDVVTALGAYLPRVWWGKGCGLGGMTPVYGRTVFERTANQIVDWLVTYGHAFDWRAVPDLRSAQEAANAGKIVIVAAQNREPRGHGHMSVILPEAADDALPEVPLQSQAGRVNLRCGRASRWWEGACYESSFWIHEGTRHSRLTIVGRCELG